MTKHYYFSPTSAVRDSTRLWMESDSCSLSVKIDDGALATFAEEIAKSIVSNKSLEVAEWDADGWHYCGKNYKRQLREEGLRMYNDDHYELMKIERVALYVLALDAINFCFWPTLKSIPSSTIIKNGLEYEHLAVALKKIAEADDDNMDDTGGSVDIVSSTVRSASSYAFNPMKLITLTPDVLHSMLNSHFPQSTTSHDGSGREIVTTVFDLPNIEQRCRLLNELGEGLIKHHNGSAFNMLTKAENSADSLVGIILNTFPGFRDYARWNGCSDSLPKQEDWEAVKTSSEIVHFYKRAQIATADIWAALGCCRGPTSDHDPIRNVCKFNDINELTTFPDYRVPQILRHAGVLQYARSLADTIDRKEELRQGCNDEISIRAGTVVAVERLVMKVKDRIRVIDSTSEEKRSQESTQMLVDKVSAVTIDWYLWQKGERLDRMNSMGPHHRVYTTFY